MPKAWIGIGSNLGDRLGTIRDALRMLRGTPGIRVEVVSSLYDTAPVGVDGQPRFLNLVAVLETALAPRALLGALQQIEARSGRVRRARWGPRVLDLDLLLYDALSLEEEDLVVPHKRLVERAFVLVPLSEVSPEVVVPGTGGRTVRSLLSDLERSEGDVSRVGDPPAPDDD